MIEISFGKLLLLALIALLVLGPEKLPGAARTAGALLRRVRSGWDSVRTEVERELEIEEIRRAARETVAQVQSAQTQVQDAVKSAHGMAKDMGDDVSREASDIAREVKSIAEPPAPAGQVSADDASSAGVAPAIADEAPQRALTADTEPSTELRRAPYGEPLMRKQKPATETQTAVATTADGDRQEERPHGDA
jgi:sec-independent protein translocase protein TatB